jgi:hypothetical protein
MKRARTSIGPLNALRLGAARTPRSRIFLKWWTLHYPTIPSEPWRKPTPQSLSEDPRVIVAREPAMYGLARMFELSRESTGGQLHVFRSMHEAYDLLKVTPGDFSQRLFTEDLAT